MGGYCPPLMIVAFVTLMILLALVDLAGVSAQQPEPPSPRQVGLTINQPGAYPGYALLAPMNSTETYLIDMEGRVVKTWKSDYTPALSAYLLENGNLLRPAAARNGSIDGPGEVGLIQ
jgi:hypothetical protein